LESTTLILVIELERKAVRMKFSVKSWIVCEYKEFGVKKLV
jgi:hypothetical protein